MWYFDAPHVVYGEDALNHLETLKGQKVKCTPETGQFSGCF